LLLLSTEEKKLTDQIKYKEDQDYKIKYINPLKIFKLPLAFAGSSIFSNQFNKLNKNVSDIPSNEYRIKYLINYNHISNTETEVFITLQEEPSIVIYRFKDKLIILPSLDKNEIMFERIIMSRISERYIIDYISNQILLITKNNINKAKGFLNILKNNSFKKDDLNKFITFDMEATTDLDLLNQNGKETYFDPIMISAYDFYNKKSFCKIISENPYIKENVKKNLLKENITIEDLPRVNRLKSLQHFFLNFIDKKYHKFVLYAHNLSSFDGILILESLVYMCDNFGFKLEPLIRDNKIISMKIGFGPKLQNRHRYYIEFHDSILLLLSSLDKLGETFLKDNPEFKKIKNNYLIECLLQDRERRSIEFNKFIRELQIYCEMDSLCLANIIHIYSTIVYDEFKLNIHKYPTASSLSLAIYLTHHLKSNDLIPLISGETYKDLKKAYHGGHTDVYRLYSNEPVHSYDYVSMYPTQMLNKSMPVGKINKFIGNPLLIGETLGSLSEQLAFIKCSVYVDKSINRPVYQTLVNINGELRSVCATGTFHNQMVYVPELLKYEELTHGLIKIIPESIQMGYTFESKIMFKDFIEHLFTLRKSVSKDHPLNQICKIIMNSLYGRMGLRQELTEYKFMNKLKIEKFTLNKDVTIKDIIEFTESLKSLVVTIKDSDQVNLKSSVAIAAAIAAYARMEMAPLLLDPELDIQ
jgi:DNA polymerase type B, organellar and viral